MHPAVLQLRRALAPRRRDVVVLLHSSAGSARQWRSLVDRLAQRYDVCTPEFWGHGQRAAWPGPAPLTLGDEAAFVEPILAEGRRVHLVGHSYGGAVALKAAALHPAAFESVTVYEPVLFRWLVDGAPAGAAAAEVLAIADTMREQLQRGDAYRAAAPFIDYWCGDGTWESMPLARREPVALRMRAVLAHFEALFGDPLAAADLRRVKAPLLVLSGAGTRTGTALVASQLSAALPAARHEVLPGMAHMGPITHAFDIDRRIERAIDAAVKASEFPRDRAAPAAAAPAAPHAHESAYA